MAFTVSNQQMGVGTTLKVWHDYIQVMSDEWASTTFASYWDELTGSIKTSAYAMQATVDVTEETKAAVSQFILKNAVKRATETEEEETKKVTKGSVVKVLKGRESVGATGMVVAIIERPYRAGYRSSMENKYGIALTEEKILVTAANGKTYENYKDVVWVWGRNCELVTVPEVDTQKVFERAHIIWNNEMARWKLK
jgi:hypothetical protein